MSDKDTICGLDQIAEYLGVSVPTVKGWIKRGLPEGRAIRKMGGQRVALRSDLDLIRVGMADKIEGR